MAAPLFLGLDVGTSGVKALLVRPSGEVAATAVAALTLSTPHPGWAEQNPDDWWRACLDAIRDVLAQAPGAAVASIGISGQMHSSVFLDAAGDVIRPALLWCDGRTTAECREITERVGGEGRLRKLACNPALEGFTLPKVLWLRNHEPAAFARLSKVLLPKDYIRYRLTGALATEPSDASATLMYDTAHLRWSSEILGAVDLPMSLMPDVGGSSEVVGRVSAVAAAATGLPVDTPVVGGGADNACGAVGVGAVDPGEAVTSWGTSGTVLSPMREPHVDPALRAHTFCHVAPGLWYLMGVVLSAGGAFAWYRDQFAREYADASTANAALRDEAEAIAPGADGVTFLPYLQGERTPHRDASLRGALVGLSLAHTRAHVTRAVFEGIAFALNDSLTILRELGLGPSHMLLTGGGAKYPLLRRIQSDVFGLKVCRVNREEGPAYGAALLGAVGISAFPDVRTAARATLKRSAWEEPDVDAHNKYLNVIARYHASYGAARRTGSAG
ncbi:MAG TPA: xylulokinase [Gemmatimonadaceae bacterium]